ncbi:Transposase_IS4 [Hexamita inflata]|uniref:Transposase IS4 n=1 Tax=Hexamita inflata TaxID=28002 RepID=A0AA86TTP1_9EUKA|nr:Transposase IS4 [Hexamita inflata]
MATANECIYKTFTEIFTPMFYENIKIMTEARKIKKFKSRSKLNIIEFDKYLIILFTMMMSGRGRGSAESFWSENSKIRNQFIADEVGMSFNEWQEIHSSICYGHVEAKIDVDDGLYNEEQELSSDASDDLSEDNDQDLLPEELIEEINQQYVEQQELFLKKSGKETQVRDTVKRVQSFMDMLQTKFHEIFNKYPDYFVGKNLVIDEQLIKFAGRIFFLQYNPNKPAKRGILVRTCVDTFTNFVLSMDLYAASQTKGTTDTLSVIQRLISNFNKQSNCTLFCDNYYSTIKVVEYIKSLGYNYVGTFQPGRLSKKQKLELVELGLNEVKEYKVDGKRTYLFYNGNVNKIKHCQ